MRRISLGITGAFTVCATLLAGGLGAQQMSSDIPVNPFARPGGPYAVGTYDWLWVDDHRPERYTKDPGDKRRTPSQGESTHRTSARSLNSVRARRSRRSSTSKPTR
jgi:hypothetical protein